ncbi:DUF3347 domain-containing protein [Flavobacterium urocaniciphilum]|uniref:Uncharacterized protein n=1 Tax=Flavobacterium urocaniciphilum TaxID=1299341 RepID=A0A1H8ZQY0_9FLAO|nr:DUF3347 domain-containing protein [Flavobacterium urocaniciphilum]SEP66623.1 Protein of unknown function [Flavobacterium urocaniciphilum]
MKAIIMSAFFAVSLVSCNHKTKEAENVTQSDSTQIFSCPMHPEVTGKKGVECSKCGMELTEPVEQTEQEKDSIVEVNENIDTTNFSKKDTEKEVVDAKTTTVPFSINEIVVNYLKIKNALANDDAKTAANVGKALNKIIASSNTNSLAANQKNKYLNIVNDAKVHVKHIGDNSGKIDHQREHFVKLSKNVNDLIVMFGSKQKLYQDYCPMYNDGKGAYWISETKEIKNPYYGSEMLACGSLKKTY